MSSTSPNAVKPIPPAQASDSPTNRRLSLGSGNDGAGGQMFKSLQKKRTNSLDKQAAYADQSKSPLYEKFKSFVKGGSEKP